MNTNGATGARKGMVLTLWLGVFFLVNGFVFNAILSRAISVPLNETVLDHTWGLLKVKGGDDSWGAMQIGLDHFAAAPDAPLYTSVFFNGDVRFQYPPSALFALSAMHAAAPGHVRTDDEAVFEGWPPVNDIIGLGFVLLTFVAVAVLLEVLLRQRGIGGSRSWQVARVAVVLGLTLTFYPVVKAFTLGQIQAWINALMALAVLCIVLRWKIAAGLLIGFVCLIKPHYALLLAWGVLRGEWRMVASAAVVGAIGLVVSVTVFGFENHLDYLRVISFLSMHGESYYPNHSVNGLLNRLMGVFEPDLYVNLEFPAGKFPPFNPWVYGLTLISTVCVLVPALLRRPRGRESSQILDFAVILVSCTLASPIAWEHHYGVFLPVFIVLFVDALDSPKKLAWLATAYALVSNYIPLTQLLAPTILNVAQSYVLFGAVVTLTLLYVELQRVGCYVPGLNWDAVKAHAAKLSGKAMAAPRGTPEAAAPLIRPGSEFPMTQLVTTPSTRNKRMADRT